MKIGLYRVVYSADVSFKVDSQEFLLLYCGIMENLKNLKQNYLKKKKQGNTFNKVLEKD